MIGTSWLLFSALVGAIMALACIEQRNPKWAWLSAGAGIGSGFGIGVASCTFYLARLMGAPPIPIVVAFQVALLGIGGFLLYRRAPASSDLPPDAARHAWIPWTALAICVAFAVFAFSEAARVNVHGDWDAWSFWNLRAKFLAAPDDRWAHAISGVPGSHPDSGLLLSSAVAAAWTFQGSTDPSIPQHVGLLFYLATILTVSATVSLIRGPVLGAIAGLLLTLTSGFVVEAVAQYSDVPQGFYFAASVSMLVLAAMKGSVRSAALAGLLAGMAAWTKNEGVVFFVAFLVASIALFLRRRPLLVATLAGAVAVAALVRWDNLASSWAGRAFDVSRSGDVLSTTASQFASLGTGLLHPALLLLLCVVLLGVRRSTPDPGQYIAPTLALTMIATDLAVLAATPPDLQTSTAGRLWIQVWPLLLFGAVLYLRTPVLAVSETSQPVEKSRKVARR